jgi:hypothetical protein
VATSLRDLPRFLVLEPVSTVRLQIRLAAPACEIDVELENPRAGRSFVLLIGHKEGPYVQRVRLSGQARIHFDPQAPGEYLLLLANPNSSPLVLRIRARDLPGPVPAEPAPSVARKRRAAPKRSRPAKRSHHRRLSTAPSSSSGTRKN